MTEVKATEEKKSKKETEEEKKEKERIEKLDEVVEEMKHELAEKKKKAEKKPEKKEDKTEAGREEKPAEADAKEKEPEAKVKVEKGKVTIAIRETRERGRGRFARKRDEERILEWIPKTELGKSVIAGKYKTLEEILLSGKILLESEIVDYLIPDMKQEVIYIGGSPGKGGGIRRTATKMTARMHKSGRRFKLAALSVVGNGNGIVGVGRAISREHRTALEKATKTAKLNIIRVRRGCGSWECGCDGEHSIPFKTTGSSGSVTVTLLPAPKGVGSVASEETKKILKLAGIKDVWVKTKGKTATRTNLILAVFDAMKNLNTGKGDL